MPISNTLSLFKLIKSMTKADKRNFKLYAKRVQGDESLKFIKLFEVLDKMSELDEKKLLDRLPGVNKGQLSNLKRHLYSQILISLRLISIGRLKAIEVREQIDFSQVLYSKGLYLQSLKLLQRAKKITEKEELDILTLEIIELQKVIESRHITNSGPLKNDALTLEAQATIKKVDQSIMLSNLRVNLHSYYIRNSHVKNDQERVTIIHYFNERLPQIDKTTLGFPENVYLYQCYVWYYYILLDFKKCYDYAVKWIAIFDENPELKLLDKDLYMRGYHYLLTASFNLKDIDKLETHLAELEVFRKSNYAKFNENSKIFSFLYVHWARYNTHFLKGTHDLAIKNVPRSLRRIKLYAERIAPHRVMVLYYKIAWSYLGDGNPGKCVTYVSKIINDGKDLFREDIQSYSRLLYLMAHYDLDNMELMPYLVRTVESYFKKVESKNKLQIRTLRFFKKIPSATILGRQKLLVELREDIAVIASDPYEIRSLLYLDVMSWVSARIDKLDRLPGMM